MLPYFPLDDAIYKMSLGVQALNPDRLIEVDPDNYHQEINLKNKILEGDYAYYFQAPSITEPLQWETLELLLPNMAKHYPHYFDLKIKGANWHWQNHLLDSGLRFRLGDRNSLSMPPLDWLGRQMQEDLLILDGTIESIPLVAGQLCFPNGWCLNDKMGKSFLAIHHEVPLFAEQIGRSSQLMMKRLKAGRPTWRVNWSVVATDQLNYASKFAEAVKATKPTITAQNAGERCFMRIERQGFLRLARTNGALFTIHTYQTPLNQLVKQPTYAQKLLGVLKTAPPEILDYKGITPFAEALINYLELQALAVENV